MFDHCASHQRGFFMPAKYCPEDGFPCDWGGRDPLFRCKRRCKNIRAPVRRGKSAKRTQVHEDKRRKFMEKLKRELKKNNYEPL